LPEIQFRSFASNYPYKVNGILVPQHTPRSYSSIQHTPSMWDLKLMMRQKELKVVLMQVRPKMMRWMNNQEPFMLLRARDRHLSQISSLLHSLWSQKNNMISYLINWRRSSRSSMLTIVICLGKFNLKLRASWVPQDDLNIILQFSFKNLLRKKHWVEIVKMSLWIQ